jgi:hypothetical protein
MPVLNHTITISIAGIDRTAYLRANSLFIRSSINNNGDVAEFTIIDDGTWQILDWQEVEITIDAVTVFGGYITASDGVAEGDPAHKTTFWRVECRDWTALLDTVLVDVAFTSKSEAAIIDFLFDTYLPGDGFDYNSEINSHYPDVIDIYFDNITLREALNKLAEYTKAQWHIDPEKTLFYYGETDPVAAAFNIDTVSPNNSTTFDVLARSLKATTDSIEIVNKVVVVGGQGQSRTRQVDTFTADTLVIVYGPLLKEPSAIYSVTWTDSAGTHTAYADQIGIYPQETTDDEGNIITPAEQYYPVIANVDTHYIEFDISPETLTNATTITVEYYYREPIKIIREDASSQALYGRVFTRAVFDDSLVNLEMAARYGDKILEDYANGRITVHFDITRFGLLPGRLITINTPAFAINPLLGGLLYASDRGGYFLLENDSDRIALEQYDEPRNFIIQEVAIQTVAVQQDEFMIVASVTCGFWRRSIVDSMRDLSNATYNTKATNRVVASLSQLSPSLGEVVTGRAVFTDGGTAAFEWTDYAHHTGAVMGLDSGGGTARGAFYILDNGTVRAKVGYLTGLGSVGTVPTSGWGIYTTNGFFSGVVAASQFVGGTITGNLISGGTVSGALVTGGTVSAVGGSVSISNTLGFRSIVSNTEPSQDARSVLWQTSNGSVVAEMGAYRDGTVNVALLYAGVSDFSSRGALVLKANGDSGGSAATGNVTIHPSSVVVSFAEAALTITANGLNTHRLSPGSGSVIMAGNFVPSASNTYHIGNSVSAFRHLYLDSNGAGIYRLYVNSGGSLVVEHV